MHTKIKSVFFTQVYIYIERERERFILQVLPTVDSSGFYGNVHHQTQAVECWCEPGNNIWTSITLAVGLWTSQFNCLSLSLFFLSIWRPEAWSSKRLLHAVHRIRSYKLHQKNHSNVFCTISFHLFPDWVETYTPACTHHYHLTKLQSKHTMTTTTTTKGIWHNKECKHIVVLIQVSKFVFDTVSTGMVI